MINDLPLKVSGFIVFASFALTGVFKLFSITISLPTFHIPSSLRYGVILTLLISISSASSI